MLGEIQGKQSGIKEDITEIRSKVNTVAETQQTMAVANAVKAAECTEHTKRIETLERKAGVSGPHPGVKYGAAGVGGATVVELVQQVWMFVSSMITNKPHP